MQMSVDKFRAKDYLEILSLLDDCRFYFASPSQIGSETGIKNPHLSEILSSLNKARLIEPTTSGEFYTITYRGKTALDALRKVEKYGLI